MLILDSQNWKQNHRKFLKKMVRRNMQFLLVIIRYTITCRYPQPRFRNDCPEMSAEPKSFKDYSERGKTKPDACSVG